LQKLGKLGHTVEIASGGRQALAAIEARGFDLVFMDVHMADMDGLEATAEIRRREAGTGRHLPIIAMTARAMHEDRVRCREAGMDGFVSKPVRDSDLERAVRNALRTTGTVEREHEFPDDPEKPAVNVGADAVDRERYLERVGGDEVLLRELVTAFLEDAPRLILELKDAERDDDPDTLCRAAHTLKGMLLFFEARTAADTALRLETMGRLRRLGESDALIASLSQDLERLRPLLTSLFGPGGL
jgi:CheY-like chemotaxis protein/HPt (histidine-containing phosphotransfer) domain-containing protein